MPALCSVRVQDAVALLPIHEPWRHAEVLDRDASVQSLRVLDIKNWETSPEDLAWCCAAHLVAGIWVNASRRRFIAGWRIAELC